MAIPGRDVIAQSSSSAFHCVNGTLRALQAGQRIAGAGQHAVEFAESLADRCIILSPILGIDSRWTEERRRFRPDAGERR